MEGVKLPGQDLGEGGEGQGLLAPEAARQHRLAPLQVLGPELHTEGHPLELPLVELVAGGVLVPVVQANP